MSTNKSRIGVCTGCKQVFPPGPYFKRRIVRHLRLAYHNHDAVELIGVDGRKERGS